MVFHENTYYDTYKTKASKVESKQVTAWYSEQHRKTM